MPQQKKLKALQKRIAKLNSRIRNLMRAGEPFHRESAQLHILLSQASLSAMGKRPEHLAWFTDACLDEEIEVRYQPTEAGVYPGSSSLMSKKEEDVFRMPIPGDTGGLLLQAADSFSHIKSVQFTGVPNWVKLTDGLTLGLLLTDLKGTTGADVKMPLPSFIIELPDGVVQTYDVETCWHETKYIIVTEAVSPHFGDALFLYAWSQPNENSVHLFDDHAEYFPLDLSYADESLADVIETYEEIRSEEIAKFGSAFGRDSLGRIFGEEYVGPAFREKLLRIIINTVIYMTSASAVVKHEKQAAIDKLLKTQERRPLKLKERKQLEQLEDDPHYILGTDIIITHNDVETIEAAQNEDIKRSSSRRTLKHPSITRGHWRWQPYGPRRSKRKRIWIRPYIRGKELGGTVRGHTYQLENPFEM